MRINKLSPKDIDFPDRDSVASYFIDRLPNRNPVGQFLLTQGRIAAVGIQKNIVRTQGWPRIQDSLEVDQIWNALKR